MWVVKLSLRLNSDVSALALMYIGLCAVRATSQECSAGPSPESESFNALAKYGEGFVKSLLALWDIMTRCL